jgi:hypothetical protein
MPQAVVFATKRKGGVGVLDLATEQGVCQTQILISHMRAKTYISTTLYILIKSYELHAGVNNSILLRPCPMDELDSRLPTQHSVYHLDT